MDLKSMIFKSYLSKLGVWTGVERVLVKGNLVVSKFVDQGMNAVLTIQDRVKGSFFTAPVCFSATYAVCRASAIQQLFCSS